MSYLALGCALIAIVILSLLTVPWLHHIYLHAKPDLKQNNFHKKSLFNRPHYPLLWKISHFAGRSLLPFVTWSQRRKLNSHIERAGLSGWDFFQIYCLQLSGALTALFLCACWLLHDLLTLRAEAYIALFISCTLGWWLPIFWLKRMYRSRVSLISRQLPFFLDMVGLGLDAGLNLQASVQLALEHVGEGALHQEWSKMLADMRAGQSRAQALRQLSRRLDLSSVRQLISSLIQGEAMGFSLGRIIQVYADQQRAFRLMQAEKQALQAPVKMLFPMALCIFPCTFIVLGFPVVVQLMGLK